MGNEQVQALTEFGAEIDDETAEGHVKSSLTFRDLEIRDGECTRVQFRTAPRSL